jgi:hypothetical protein
VNQQKQGYQQETKKLHFFEPISCDTGPAKLGFDQASMDVNGFSSSLNTNSYPAKMIFEFDDVLSPYVVSESVTFSKISIRSPHPMPYFLMKTWKIIRI